MNVLILGTRGIPAKHGGFETFAEKLALYLVSKGHAVTVYCQPDEKVTTRHEMWRGIELIKIYGGERTLGTMLFDLACVRDAIRRPGVILTLGYNTALFSLLYRLVGRESVMNMDGIEWRRPKWSFSQRLWLRLNEYAGAKLSTHLIADHPEIARHLEHVVPEKKITTIAYGADCCYEMLDAAKDARQLEALGVTPQKYALVIARAEPENSIMEIINAFSSRPREIKLLVLGKYRPDEYPYQRDVLNAAGSDVIFPGAIYDESLIAAIRRNALFYVHGHTVGGTNPSLVEALSASNPVVAHDNCFTRWVAGPDACYFTDTSSLATIIDSLLCNPQKLAAMRESSKVQHSLYFQQEPLLRHYETLLSEYAHEESVSRDPKAVPTGTGLIPGLPPASREWGGGPIFKAPLSTSSNEITSMVPSSSLTTAKNNKMPRP